ncbi:MAG TPA: hypothetical protein VNH11_35960, partial [Pirellulales bacterium]|nr:hypothetical protein [Pirellulales bacterium]
QNDLFADSPPASFTPAEALADRRQQLASLSAELKEDLQRKYERFIHLPTDEQKRLVELESAIKADERRRTLETTVAAYDQWLKQLSGVERAELMALDATARLVRIKRLRQEEARRLTPEDGQAFVAWIERRLTSWLDDKPGLKRQFEAAPEGRRRELLARGVNELRRSRPLVFAGTFGDRSARNELRERLSPRGQQQLDQAQTPDQRRLLLQSWFLQTLSPQAVGRGQLALPKVDEEELKRFFERDLDPAQRAQLLNLPADQMRRQLLRLYHARSGK